MNESQSHYLYNLFSDNDMIKIMDIGMHKTPPSHVYGPAVRPYYLLHFVVKGNGYIERNGIKTFLCGGQAFLIYPEEITTYASSETDPWEYFWISFSGEFAKTLVEKTTDKLVMNYHKSGLIALQTAFYDEKADYLTIISTLLEVLKSIKTFSSQKGNLSAEELALKFIESNYFHQITVSMIADKFGFSRSHFTMLFIKKFGESPYDYLTKIRISKAKEYLLNTKYSIEEIAYSVGFSSLQRFSETFKKRVGISPYSYRKTNFL